MNIVDATMFRAMIRSGTLDLKRHCDEVNSLNVFPVPDGDTGLNMFSTIYGGLDALEAMNEDSLGACCKALSRGMLLAARGNSGVILSQFFAGFTEIIGQYEQVNVLQFSQAFESGVHRAYEVVVKPVEGTILTVMREGSEYAISHIDSSTSFEEYFTHLLFKMKESLKNTPELLPILKEAGVIDSGGAGLLYIIEGMAQALGGKIIEDVTLIGHDHDTGSVDFSAFDENSVLDYGYCTEFILQLTNEKDGVKKFNLNACIEYFGSLGDSLVAFQDGTIVKVHVHTKTPDRVIGYALQYGEFVRFKLENMTLQHHQTLIEKSRSISFLARPEQGKKAMASVAVVPSEEVGEVFKTYGIDVALDVGRLMNPKTEDFVRAFKEANADDIFVFPNNKNEIMVAKMAAEMYPSSQIHIIETSDIAEGISCCSVLDLVDLSVEDNLLRAKDGLKSKTFSLFIAARETSLNGVSIAKGDYVYAREGKCIAKGANAADVFAQFLNEANAEEASLLIIVYGSRVDALTRQDLESLALSKSEFMEIQAYEGGDLSYDIYAILE